MSALTQVPAWFWVTLGTILAMGGAVAGVIYSRHTRYHPEHAFAVPPVVAEAVATLAETVEHRVRYGSMILAEERALHHEPTAAEVAASRAAHGYIPELDPDAGKEVMPFESTSSADLPVHDVPDSTPVSAGPGALILGPAADDLGPGAGITVAGYNSHLPSPAKRMKVDSPAPDDLPEGSAVIPLPYPLNGVSGPPPSRLLRTTGELLRADLLADACAFMARQDTEVVVWLAGFRERWAAA